MDQQARELFDRMNPIPAERPSGTARSPYVRRQSAQLRISEVDRSIAELAEAKRKLHQVVESCDREIEAADTLRGTPEQAPSRDSAVYGEI